MAAKKVIISVTVGTIALIGSAVAVVAQEDGPPPQPPWVQADGHSVDVTKLPALVPVLGPDGKAQRDGAGNVVMVNPKLLRDVPLAPAATSAGASVPASPSETVEVPTDTLLPPGKP